MPVRFLPLLLLLALVTVSACTTRDAGPTETTGAECSNGSDDDRDGEVDCADTDCSIHPACDGFVRDAGVSVDARALPIDIGPRPDGPVPSCSAALDIGFVLDVSTSMDDEAARMRDGIESIWNAAHALTSNAQFGLVVFVDDALADGGCTPYADLAALRGRFDHWRSFCASNLSPVSETSNSDCAENSLDALYLAAESCPWRDDSTRVLIHVTDDTFVERPSVLSGDPFGFSGVRVQRTNAEVAAELVRPELRVGAFAAPGAGEECGAGSSANVGQGFHEAYLGMPSLPEQTGGRAWSIRDVRSGSLDMADAINELIADEYCTLF